MAAFDPRNVENDAKKNADTGFAGIGDLPFLIDLQKKNSAALGYLPAMALKWYADHRMVLLAKENEEPAGYILGRPSLRFNRAICPIYQAAVAFDAQRRHHGLALLERLEAIARGRGQLALQANCASDLEANEFWAAAGFRPIVCMTPDNARGRDLICWRKPLTKLIPSWFIEPPARAGGRNLKPQFKRLERHKNGVIFRGQHYLLSNDDPTSS